MKGLTSLYFGSHGSNCQHCGPVGYYSWLVQYLTAQMVPTVDHMNMNKSISKKYFGRQLLTFTGTCSLYLQGWRINRLELSGHGVNGIPESCNIKTWCVARVDRLVTTARGADWNAKSCRETEGENSLVYQNWTLKVRAGDMFRAARTAAEMASNTNINLNYI